MMKRASCVVVLAVAVSAAVSASGAGDLVRVTVDPGEAASVVRAIEARGGSVVRRLGAGELLVEVDGARGVSGLAPELRSRPWIPEDAFVPWLRTDDVGDALQGVVVVLASGAGDGRAVELLEAAGGRVEWRSTHGGLLELGVRLEGSVWPGVRDALRTLRDLVSVDVQGGARLRNTASAWLCQSGVEGVLPLDDVGLFGDGQVVGMIDTGIDADHCFFSDSAGLPPMVGPGDTTVDSDQRKILAVDFLWDAEWPDPGPVDWDTHGHGTHVAGSVAGDRVAFGTRGRSEGMAPHAKLVVQDAGHADDPCAELPGLGCPLAPLTPVFEQAYAQGARIHTNSWGDREDFTPHNRYTERTAEIDQICREYADLLVVYAAGNDGPGQGTVGSPATAKNVLAVGATTHGSVEPVCVVQFSSRGWTDDGRVKPDLVVPGTSIISARNDSDVETDNCDEWSMSGTSMAAPTAAGLAALVRQYYVDGYYPDGVPTAGRGFVPSSALLRATLIASTVDLADLGCSTVEPAPSAGQGWGLVRLDSVLPLPDNDRRLIVSDRPRTFFGGGDGPVRMTFDVVEAGTLEVVLAWTDPASSPQATSHLVNDLDLELRGPDGTFLGNVLTDGASTTGGEPDRTNNIEVVRLPTASPGRWEVRVSPAVLVNPPQGYAVVVSGAVRSREPRRPAHRVASAAAVTSGAPASAPPSSHGTRTGDLLDPHPTP